MCSVNVRERKQVRRRRFAITNHTEVEGSTCLAQAVLNFANSKQEQDNDETVMDDKTQSADCKPSDLYTYQKRSKRVRGDCHTVDAVQNRRTTTTVTESGC